jgi:glycosyltransferase involved in cell wall biosynthesis
MNPIRPRILLFGYLPPPYFGPATAYQALLRSMFVQRLDVTFINLSVVKDLRELEKFRIGKLFKLAWLVFVELFYLLTRRFDFVCYPVSVNRNAFIKDAALLGLVRLFGVPTVLWAHGNNLPDFRARSPRWLQAVIDWTLRRALAAIVLGERLRFNFQRHIPDERIFVVPLGIEPPPPVPAVEKGPDMFTILYLGNLIREKGVFTLLEAAPLILAQYPATRFVFGGAWWRKQDRLEAERFVRERGLDSRVEFVGLVTGEAKWRTLAQADLLAFPTFYYYETFGFVLLEAMHAGLPVVTTCRASIPEIIKDGVNGLLVEEQDAGDLAEKILRLVGDPALRRRMGAANREKFTNYYTYEHYGQRMVAVFEQLGRRP